MEALKTHNVVWRVKTPAPPPAEPRLELFEHYTDKSFIVVGETLAVKDELMALHGGYNRALTHPLTGDKVPGYIFSNKRREAVRQKFGL